MMNIDLSTQAAQDAVDALGTKLQQLAPKAQAAGEGMKEGLNFAKVIRAQFSGIKGEFAAMRSALDSLQKEFQAVNGEVAAHVTMTKGMADMSRMVSKALTGQTGAIRAQTASLKAAVQAGAESAKQEEKSNAAKRNTTRILGLLRTATSARRKDEAVINKLLEDGKIKAGQAARAHAMLRDTYDKIGTSAETYLAALKRTNSQMGKSKYDLAEMAAGWGILGKAQREATFAQIHIQELWQRSGKYVKEALTPIQQYTAALKALRGLRDLGTAGQDGGITSTQYTAALQNLKKDYREILRLKKEVAKPEKIAPPPPDSAAKKYLDTLIRTNQEAGKTTAQLATMRAGWKDLGADLQGATLHQIRLSEAFAGLGGKLRPTLSAMEQYQRQLAHLAVLRKEFENTRGGTGVSAHDGAAIERGLTAELQKSIEAEKRREAARLRMIATTRKLTDAEKALINEVRKSSKELANIHKLTERAATGFGRLNSEFHIGAQAAAGFRAAMHGANLGFGIFTSSTILTATAVYGLTKGMTESIRVGAEFQRSFQRAAVMMKSFEEIASGGANAITGETKAVRELVLNLAETTQYSATEVANAASVLALSGQDAFEIYNNLASVLDLASVGMMEMSQAADIATGMMASFAMESADFERAVDVLAATAAKTKASVEDIGMSMTYIGPIAHQAGASIEEVAGAMGILAENNIRSSKAGTAMRRIFTNILAPTEKGSKAFKRLGIDIEALTADGVNLVEVFQALNAAGADVPDLKAIFDQYATAAATSLTMNAGNLGLLTKQMETQVKGFAARTRDALTENFELAVEELKNVIQRGMIAAFDQFGPGLEKDIRALSEALRGETGNIAAVISKLALGVIRAAKDIITNFDKIRTILSPILKTVGDLIGFVTKHIGWLTVAFVGLSVVKTIHGSLGLLSKGLLAVSTAAKAAALRNTEFAVSAAQFGGVTSAGYIKAVNESHAAMLRLPVVIGKIDEAQQRLKKGGIPFPSDARRRLDAVGGGFLAVGRGADGAVKPVGLFTSALGKIGGAASAGLAILGGWPGVLISIALTALPYLIYGLDDASEKIYEFSGAVDTLATFEGRIGDMSERVRLELMRDLNKDIETSKAQIDALKKQLETLPERQKDAKKWADAASVNSTLNSINPLSHVAALAAEYLARKKLVKVLGEEKGAREALAIANERGKETAEAAAKLTEENAKKADAARVALEDAFGLKNLDLATSTELVAGFSPAIDGVASSLETIDFSVFSDSITPITTMREETDNLVTSLANFLSFLLSFINNNPLRELIPDYVLTALGNLSSGMKLMGKNLSFNTSTQSMVGIGSYSLGDLGFGPNARLSSNVLHPNQPNNVRTGEDGPDAAELKEQAAALKSATAELTKYFEAYEKGTGSAMGLNRELAQIDKAIAAVKSNSPAAIASLKEMGYNAEEGLKALDWSKAETTFEFVTQQLGKIDPRFKDLTLSMAEAEVGAIKQGQEMAELEKVLRTTTLSTEDIAVMMGLFERAIMRVNDPTAKLADEFKKLKEESNNLMAGWDSPSTFDGMVKKFESVDDESKEFTLAVIRASKVFGDFQNLMGETEQLEENRQLLALLVKGNGEYALSAELAARAEREKRDSMPIGKMEEENRQLQIRIRLLGRSAEEQYIINAALGEYGSYLEDMPDQFARAAQESYRLNEEMKRIEEIKGAYQQFGDGLARMLSGVFDGSIKSFGDMVDKFKDLFKQLLAELAYMAIKNTIMVNFTGGTGGGGSGGLISSLVNAFVGGGGGGGTAGGIATGAQAMMSMGGIGSGGSGMSSATNNGMINMLSQLGSMNGGTGAGVVSNTGGSSVGGNLGSIGGMRGASIMAGVAGAYMGYQAHRGQSFGTQALSTASYAAAGYYGATLALGAYTGAAAATAATGAIGGAAAGASTAAAAIPIVGWILAAIALVDWATGGRVMGTDYRPEKYTSTVGIRDGNPLAQASIQEWRYTNANPFRDFGNWGLGQRRSRERNIDPPDELEQAAQQFYDQQVDVARRAARQFRNTVAPLIEGTFSTVLAFNDKGKRDEKNDKTFATILGKQYADITMEEFAKRMSGFQILSQVANNLTAEQIGRGGYNWSATGEGGAASAGSNRVDLGEQAVENRFNEIFEGIEAPAELQETVEGWQSSFNAIMSIAARWESNADLFAEGAEFLLNAAVDMVNGIGLLGDEGTLAEITDLIEGMQMGEESLIETYTRVVKSVAIVEATLSAFGVEAGRTRLEFVEFSEELVSVLGGVDAARQSLETFTQAFGQLGVIADYQAASAQRNRTAMLERVGLDPNTTAEEFVEAFAAALPNLSGAETADWIAAGQPIANVALALRSMREQLEGGQTLADQIETQIQAMRVMGAQPAEIAEAVSIGTQILARALTDFMQQINADLATFEGDDYAFRLASINAEMERSLAEAQRLGAGEEDLMRIRRRAQFQIDDIATQLSDFMFGIEGQIAAIEGHPVQHHLQEIARQMEVNIRQARSLGASEGDLARIRRLAGYQMTAAINELRMSIRTLVADFYAVEENEDFAEAASSQAAEMRAAAESLYDQEMQRYEDAQEAIKRIAKFLTDLEIGELNPGSWEDRLGAARGNFMQLFQRAAGGDTEALNEITGAAQSFLDLGREFYGSTTGYADIYNLVTSMLRQLNVTLAEVQQPAALPPDTSESEAGSSAAETERDRLTREAQRFQQALQIAQQLGDLALSLKVNVFELLTEYGVKLGDLATALGININNLTRDTTFSLQLLAGALGTSVTTVMSELGISIGSLATAFGVSLDNFNLESMRVLAEFATAIGVDIVEMAGMLNISVTDFGAGLRTALIEGLGTLPNLPQELTDAMKPFLEGLTGAGTPDELRTAINALSGFVGGLPDSQRLALTPILEGVGITVGTALTTNEATLLAGMKTAIDFMSGAISSQTSTLQFIDPRGVINTGNNILSSISTGIGDLNSIMSNVLIAVGGVDDSDSGIKSYGMYTPTQEDQAVVELYSSMATDMQTQQDRAAEQTQALVEKLEELNENVSVKLDKLNDKQAINNRHTASIKNTTRLKGIADATTRKKKGRTK